MDGVEEEIERELERLGRHELKLETEMRILRDRAREAGKNGRLDESDRA